MSPNSGTGTDKVTSFHDWFVQTLGGQGRGTADYSRILIQSYNFQVGKKLLAISQKQATTPDFMTPGGRIALCKSLIFNFKI